MADPQSAPVAWSEELERLLCQLQYVEHRKFDTIDDWVREKNAIKDRVHDLFAASEAATVARLAGTAPGEMREKVRDIVGWTIVIGSAIRRNDKPAIAEYHDERQKEVDALLALFAATQREREEAEREPQEGEEPSWPGWFSCEECLGWFKRSPVTAERIEPVCFDSGREICGGCEDRERAEAKLAEIRNVAVSSCSVEEAFAEVQRIAARFPDAEEAL